MTTEIKAWCPFRSWTQILGRVWEVGALIHCWREYTSIYHGKQFGSISYSTYRVIISLTYSLHAIETQHMNSRKFARHVTTALLTIEIILKTKMCPKNKWIMYAIGINVQWLRWINIWVLTWEDIKVDVEKKENYIYIHTYIYI